MLKTFHYGTRVAVFVWATTVWLGIWPSTVQAADSAISYEQLFAPDRLLQVEITLPAAEWDQLRRQKRNLPQSIMKSPPESPFTYFRADVVIEGVAFKNVGIRKKGFVGSIDSTRPSLKIKLNEYQRHGEFGGVDRLTLNNNKQDKSIVSQYLAYKLFRAAGVPASACNFAHVSVNGESLGVYSNVESIKKHFLKRRFGSSKGNLYEGCLSDFMEGAIERFQIKNNEKTSDRSDIELVARILAGNDDEWFQQLDQVVDVDAFIRYWAMESLMAFWDGYANNQNNYFLYKNPQDGRFQFIPWGTDAALSKMGFQFLFQLGPKSVRAKAALANRIYADPAGRQRYRALMLKLLDEVWDEQELERECHRIQKLVEDSLHSDQESFPNALAETERFVRNRRAEIMAEIKDGTPDWEFPATKPFYFAPRGRLVGEFQTVWSDKEPADPYEQGSARITRLEIDSQAIDIRRAGVISTTTRGQPAIVLWVETTKGAKLKGFAMIDPVDFERELGEPVNAAGEFSEQRGLGDLFNPRPSLGSYSLAGEVQLDAAGRDKGDAVRGKFELEILKLRHFFSDDD